MEKYYGIAAIAGICVLVLFMGVMKQRSAVAVMVAFALRIFAGAIGICIVNKLLESQGIAVAAGINPVSLLTVGTLGISGFALIYAILFYRFL
ncbi:MAG: transcriptional regulator [Lachnospiraceae bacterium]|jgi:inhibitor of the pro-sigma K processing machinery|nr:transcriptional regulator [Lachnospiraceae bacterium]